MNEEIMKVEIQIFFLTLCLYTTETIWHNLTVVFSAHVIVARMCKRAIRSLEDELVKLIDSHRKLCRVSGYSRKKGKAKTAVKNFWESLLRLLLS